MCTALFMGMAGKLPIRFALLTLLASPALAQEATGLPDSLFGIGLGGVYEYAPYGAEGNAVGSFPMQRLISARRSLHRGASLYFEPLTENADFPFREVAQRDGAAPIATHRAYVFPVLPDNLLTLTEPEMRNLPQKVFMIEWSDGEQPERNGNDYAWAQKLCQSLEAELGIRPDITDRADNGVYRCLFSNGDREMEVSSAVGRTIQLSFTDAIETAMEGEVYSKIRRAELAGRGRGSGRGPAIVVR